MAFSAEWLALREPTDNFARDKGLLVEACKAAGSKPVIVDLGCGTGSNIRALAPYLPSQTIWHLVDNDPELLEIAKSSVSGQVVTHCMDLGEINKLPLESATLVTGSALLDLVSTGWLETLASSADVPMYFALSYNGRMNWDPEHAEDESVTNSFNAHQRSDKGLGVAMGPESPKLASEIFRIAGFETALAQSDWELGPSDQKLQNELVLGIAQAADEFGSEPAGLWGAERLLVSGKSYCTIGHEDIFAIPKKSVERTS